jgi:glycerol-3-phosphate dehydrogenase (NAD(P)+)
MSATIAVVGAGAWGTTLAALASRAGRRSTLYLRNPETARAVERSRTNARAQPGLRLPDEVLVTADLATACRDADTIVMAVPSQEMRRAAADVAPHAGAAVVVSAAKGLERGTFNRMTEVIEEALTGTSVRAVCALSGPNLAAEIAAGKPAVSVVAGRDLAAAEFVRDLLMSPRFRLYTNEDVVGVEMGGALKNVIAIGAGMADGLGVGDNAKAAFLTRGIAEIARLSVAVGAKPMTLAGLAGLGDLVATCASPLSRNNRVGRALASGRSLTEILAELTEVAEGVTTTEVAIELGRRLGVPLPITEQTFEVLFRGKAPQSAIEDLMGRDAKHEFAGILDDLPGARPERGGVESTATDQAVTASPIWTT